MHFHSVLHEVSAITFLLLYHLLAFYFVKICPPMFFCFCPSEKMAALYEWLLHYSVYNFCIAFAADVFFPPLLMINAYITPYHSITSSKTIVRHFIPVRIQYRTLLAVTLGIFFVNSSILSYIFDVPFCKK